MEKKRQRHLSIPFKNVLCWLLLNVVLFSISAHPSYASAKECPNFKIESHPIYRFIDPESYVLIQKAYKASCLLARDEGWEGGKAFDAFNSILVRFGICRDNRLNPDFERFLKNEARAPDSVVLAHIHFCQATYDPINGWQGIKIPGLRKQTSWLKNETLCQWMNETANPTGFWIQLFKQDLPTIKKYKDRTDTICQELRSGKITYDDAFYLWRQEILEVEKSLGPETVKKMGKYLKPLLDLFLK